MEFLERNSILRAKQQVIEQAIDKARESIAGLNDEEYFNVLEKLLRKNVQQGKGKICFSKKDLDRIPNGFEDRVKEIVAENQGELVIDKEPANIKDGFVLVYGEIEENCTLKALIENDLTGSQISQSIIGIGILDWNDIPGHGLCTYFI